MANVSSSVQISGVDGAGGLVYDAAAGLLGMYPGGSNSVLINSLAQSVGPGVAIYDGNPIVARWYVRFDAKNIPAAASIDSVKLTVDQRKAGSKGQLVLTSSFMLLSASMDDDGSIQTTTMADDYTTNWQCGTSPGAPVVLTSRCTLTGTGPHTYTLNSASHDLICDQDYLAVAFVEFYYDYQIMMSGTDIWDTMHVVPGNVAPGPVSSTYGDFTASLIPPGGVVAAGDPAGQPYLTITYWKDGARATTIPSVDASFTLNNYEAHNQDRKSMVPAPFGINRKGVPNLRTPRGDYYGSHGPLPRAGSQDGGTVTQIAPYKTTKG